MKRVGLGAEYTGDYAGAVRWLQDHSQQAMQWAMSARDDVGPVRVPVTCWMVCDLWSVTLQQLSHDLKQGPTDRTSEVMQTRLGGCTRAAGDARRSCYAPNGMRSAVERQF